MAARSRYRTKSWSYWNRVNYQQFSSPCSGRTWKGPIGFYDILSGNLDGPTPMLWLVASCGAKHKGDFWNTASATAATFGAGVDLGPISLSAQTGYGASEKIHYEFLRKGEIAGNSPEGPAQSSQVEADMFSCPK